MGFIRSLWEWFGTSSNKKPQKGHPDLYPLDVLKLSKELNLEEQAKILGQLGLPSENSITLSGPESLIVQRVEKARQDYVDWAMLRLNIINNDMAKFKINDEVNRTLQVDQEFERDASAIITERENLLRDLADKAKEHKAALISFKKCHNLDREADYPSSSRKFFLYSLLFFMVVLEGLFNAGFFSQGVTTGLIGGFVYAVILAAMNVCLAFCFGKFLIKWVVHKHIGLKVLGFIFILISASLLMFMALTIAHFRDSLGMGVDDPAIVALQGLQAAPFTLRDVFSWLLFFLTLFFGIAAALDGFFIDDIYPGYGRVTRNAISALEEYEEELGSLRSELNNLKEEKLEYLDDEIRRLQANLAAYEGLIQDKISTESRLQNAFHDADNSLNALLQLFRSHNDVHRGKNQRPAYFNNIKPDLKPIKFPDFEIPVNLGLASSMKILIDELLSKSQALRANIQASFNSQFDRLKPLDTHFSIEGTLDGKN